jgi:hypothetical protein
VTETQPLADRSPDELAAFLTEQRAAYDALKARGLKLDLTRGKPAPAQLDLSDALLALPTAYTDGNGVDTATTAASRASRRSARCSPSCSGSSPSRSSPAATRHW